MMLSEPAPTQADIHFRLFGFPVRIHPMFWVVSLILAMQGSDKPDPQVLAIWMVVVLVSILVHEMGHALMQQYFGGHPWITLYSFGGLASCNDCDRRPRSQILISLAGPLAGFFLAAFVVSILFATQHLVAIQFAWNPVVWMPFESRVADLAIFFLLYVNIFWGLLNLLPIYPLDGGQVSRQLFLMWNSSTGILRSLELSAGVAVLVAAYAAMQQDWYLALLFGALAFGNFQAIQFNRNHWR